MKIKIMNILIAALLAFSGLLAASPVSAKGWGANLKGLISAVDTGASTLTVTPQKGGPNVTFNVDSSTAITRLHHSASLADLQPGDRVDVRYDPSTMLASRIKADLNLVTVNGTVSGVATGAGTVTITPKGGGPDVVLNVDSTTVIKRSGAAASLADLKVSDRVEATYNPVTLLAASINAWPYLATLKGTISGVDTGAGTVTITPKGGGPDVVLSVDSTTVIKRSGATASLADLQVSDRVTAKYYPATLLATAISAWPNLVTVEGTISGVDTGAGKLTITPKGGGPDVVLNVDSTTVIKRSGATASLADLKVSDRVEATYNPVTLLAANINAWPYLATLKGTISGVDTGAGTVTITPKGGGPDVVLSVDSTTVIKRSGATASLADLQVSDRVTAKYYPATLLATAISAWPNLVTLKGTISGVDTGAGTLTITPKGGSPDVVLSVGSSTVIKRSGATASLANLKVGDLVEATYNPVTLLAANISAWPKIVWLWGTISAVDTGAGTVTITPKYGSGDVVLTVDSKTYIRRNLHSAKLADLQVGDHILASYDQGSMLALWLIVGY